MSVVDVRGLQVTYPGAAGPAVDGISFTIAQGEIFGFLGPSGAGKSTTQRVLCRLLPRYGGSVTAFGRSLRDWGPDYAEHIGVAFELPASYGKLTARENLQAFAALYSGPCEEPGALLDILGLGDVADRRTATFSKGMGLRLNLARALLHRPALLLLDEPTSGLDPVTSAQVQAIVRERAAAGAAVFLTTHDMACAAALCDRVAFLAGGRIAAYDTPRDLCLAHGRRDVAVEVRGQAGLVRHTFPLDGLADDRAFLSLLRQGAVETIHSREASLGEVFAAVTGQVLA